MDSRNGSTQNPSGHTANQVLFSFPCKKSHWFRPAIRTEPFRLSVHRCSYTSCHFCLRVKHKLIYFDVVNSVHCDIFLLQNQRFALVICIYKKQYFLLHILAIDGHLQEVTPVFKLVLEINVSYINVLGTTVAQWLRCCATNRKVAGSIPAGVIGISH